MHSEDRPATPNEHPSEFEPIPMLQRKYVHPDSLQFMDMAKDLLDSQPIKQAMAGEQQQPKDDSYSASRSDKIQLESWKSV